jgi:hypothetical protein
MDDQQARLERSCLVICCQSVVSFGQIDVTLARDCRPGRTPETIFRSVDVIETALMIVVASINRVDAA